jgi:glyoxylase I family protein
MIGLMKIHHIALIVSNKDSSLKFYTEILGFNKLSEYFRAERNSYKIDLERDGVRLEMFTFPDAPKRPSRPEAMGLRHLAFELQNLERFHAELKANKVENVEEIRVDEYTGKKFFFFPDPDGLPIEMYEA